MQTSRQSKWNWEPHLPRMLDLYNSGLPIPKIHKAIQSDNFRPCQRAVYDKFQSMGYPTDHDRGSRPHHAGSPGIEEANGTSKYQQLLPMSPLERNVPRATRCVPIEDVTRTAATKRPASQAVLMRSRIFGQEGNNGYHSPPVPQCQAFDGKLAARSALDAPRHPETEIGNDSISPGSMVPVDEPHLSNRLPSELSKTCQSQQHKRRNASNTPEQEVIIQNLREVGILDYPQHSGGRTKPRRAKEAPDSSTDFDKFLKSSNQVDLQGGQPGKDTATPSTHRRPIRKICSLFEMKSSASKARAKQNSSFADSDSGYQSGRRTPSTLQSRDSLISHPESLTEFRGLYKVTCYAPHENKLPGQYRETHPCHFCGCSSIHTLAWSANRLKLQDFEAELRSEDLHDIQALDAAGNSALHYAAASGAGYAHLKALIDAGVPVYARNTAYQNFLHCLRPCDAGTKSCSVDCFKLGLIKLLELIEPKVAFGQQDNDGQTILHILASYITIPELRERTFKIFRESGFPPTVLNRFGESAKDLSPSTYQVGQTMFAADTFNTIGASPPDLESTGMSEWAKKDLKKMNAYNIMIEAHHNPHYVDSTNRDTILHALSRVSVSSRGAMQKNDIILDLCQFVARGVNLNRHNRDGHHPLAAFICNQDFRGSETGATMAKYIDILLWKGGKHGGINDINVDMMTRSGTTALCEAAIQAQPDTVRSLIEAGANVNGRLNNNPRGLSVLQATSAARNKAVLANDRIRMHMFKEVISHLELAGAVTYPDSLQECGRTT